MLRQYASVSPFPIGLARRVRRVHATWLLFTSAPKSPAVMSARRLFRAIQFTNTRIYAFKVITFLEPTSSNKSLN